MPPLRRTGTALHGYDRLEAQGLWRPGWSERRQGVIVSLGEATLTLTDPADRPVAHWSLPAVRRVPGEPPLYAPAGEEGAGDPDGETLEIADAEMNAALDAILASMATEPRGGRLRMGAVALALAGAAALAVWIGPDLLRSQAAASLGPAQREELGEEVVAAMARAAGGPCAEPFGEAALRQLAIAALGDPPPRVWVLRGGPAGGGAPVPGGIVLSAAAIEAADEPGAVSARLHAEAARAGDPLERLLADGTLRELAGILVAPEVPDALLQRHAARLLALPPPARQTAEGREGLADADWLALRGICGDGG